MQISSIVWEESSSLANIIVTMSTLLYGSTSIISICTTACSFVVHNNHPQTYLTVPLTDQNNWVGSCWRLLPALPLVEKKRRDASGVTNCKEHNLGLSAEPDPPKIIPAPQKPLITSYKCQEDVVSPFVKTAVTTVLMSKSLIPRCKSLRHGCTMNRFTRPHFYESMKVQEIPTIMWHLSQRLLLWRCFCCEKTLHRPWWMQPLWMI